MAFNNSIGMILLSIWLILTGIALVTNGALMLPPVITGLLALAAGIFILIKK
jgi:hypothetical protein